MDTHTQTLAPNLVTIAEAAKLLGVHPNTVRNRIKTGLLPAEKMLTPNGDAYMIPRTTIEDALQSPLQNVGTLPKGSNELLSSNHAQNQGLTVSTGSVQLVSQALTNALQPLLEDLKRTHEELGQVRADRDHAQAHAHELEARLVAIHRRSWWRRLLN